MHVSQNRLQVQGFVQEQPISRQSTSGNYQHLLRVSWTNSKWPANQLNRDNILQYFCNHSNVFYDRTCANETLRMQNRSMEQLSSMEGIHYEVGLASEPLFVIRKQKRQANIVTPLSDYYIIAGVVYQSPDLSSVINSRIVSALDPLREAFKEARKYVRYSTSKGYYWQFSANDPKKESKETVESEKPPEQVPSSLYQRTRVDRLLALLTDQFPPDTTLEQKHNIQDIKQARKYVRYSTSKGYYWQFSANDQKKESKETVESEKPPEQVPSSLYQRTRVDRLLLLLTDQFPPHTTLEQKPNIQHIKHYDVRSEVGSSTASTSAKEITEGPPTKRLKLEPP